MDFDFSDEQTLIAESVGRLLGDAYAFEKRKVILASSQGYSEEVWAQLAELGLLALPFSEEDGGIGGGPVETMIVMETIGRTLALEPWFETAVLGGGVLRNAGSPEQRGELIEEVAAGAMKLALATTERHSRYDLAQVETRAVRDGEGWRLSGAKGVVARGDVADRFVVSARTAGGSGDEAGIGLFLVDPSAAGVTRRGYRMQDGRGACELSLENVAVGPQALLGDPEAGHVALARVADEAIAALAAEAVGVMETMQALTLAYIKERKQFGRAIGDFQVLQHRAAEMFVALEQARSMAIYAASMADEADATELRRAMAMTKVMIGQSGRLIGESAIQMHGGVGMTAEYAIGHYFKRMTMIDIAFGDAGYHLQNLAEER